MQNREIIKTALDRNVRAITARPTVDRAPPSLKSTGATG